MASNGTMFSQLSEGQAATFIDDQAPTTDNIELLERGSSRPDLGRDLRAEKKLKEQTMLFDDGVRRIDFILTYQSKTDARRERFLQSCIELGVEYEVQDCSESPDHTTYFVKVHASHKCLLKGAEDLLLRMPIEENTLKKSTWHEAFFDCIKVANPFDPKIPAELETPSYFTAPFKYECRENFIGWEKESFFSTAQRAAIVWHVMQNARFGEAGDEIGLRRLLPSSSFGQAYPLHEGTYNVKKDEDIRTERQFLYKQWASWGKWYKNQPLDNIRHYYGEKVGIYFTWLGFYTSWLLPASIVGLIVFGYGLSTLTLRNNSVADDICRARNRTGYYMCPLCDDRCDFWWLSDTCGFARVSLLFDNEATVAFAIFMAFWAVLFLEFWKRRQFKLQYDWDVLGYEAAEERARPEFEHKIKNHLSRASEKQAKRFIIFNEVLNRQEYIQPASWFLPKLFSSFSILIVMVLAVLGIFFGVLFYRIAIAGLLYNALIGVSGGPSIANIVVSITGAAIQLIFIIFLNNIYGYLALVLNNWELHRTQTEYDDSLTTKMYIFQFVNFYSSIFYIAFFKGNFTGYPGGYNRIGNVRLDDCAAYGCLLELTIQLGIIMIGKQILNNLTELGVPYVKRVINWCRYRGERKDDIYTRWEKDFDLIAIAEHGLFFEYLELVIQYGFVTIFVAAFPLAPLFALLNNWVEIRLDAHKFVTIFRRPIPERAQDIGAWYTILAVVSNLAVVTNVFLIAFTAQFIPLRLVYQNCWLCEGGIDYKNDYVNSLSPDFINEYPIRRYSGYIDFFTSPFEISSLQSNASSLLEGTAFPLFNVQRLESYDEFGSQIYANEDSAEPTTILHLPFIDFVCLGSMGYNLDECSSTYNDTDNSMLNGFTETQYIDFYDGTFDPLNTTASCGGRNLLDNNDCVNLAVECQVRNLVNQDGSRPLRYWHVFTTRAVFIIIIEHFIFIVSAILAWLVPDVPQSVKNEIQREKLLAYEAIHARHAEKVASSSASPAVYTPEPADSVEEAL